MTQTLLPINVLLAGVEQTQVNSNPDEKPATPTNIEVSIVDSQIKIEWDFQVGIYKFNVYRDNSYLATVDNAVNYYDNSNLIVGQSYGYSVVAYDESKNSGFRYSSRSAETPIVYDYDDGNNLVTVSRITENISVASITATTAIVSISFNEVCRLKTYISENSNPPQNEVRHENSFLYSSHGGLIENLEPNTSYFVRTIATFQDGKKEYSDVITFVTPDTAANNETRNLILAYQPTQFTHTVTSTVYNSTQLESAINSSSSGDVILMHSTGSFKGLANPITKAFADDNPLTILQQSSAITPASSGVGEDYPVIFTDGAANINWHGLKIEGQDTVEQCLLIGGYQQSWGGAARNINIYGGELRGSYYANVAINEGSHDIYIEDLKISRSGYGAPSTVTGAGENAYMGSGGGSPGSIAYNITFKGCTFEESRAEWIDVKTASYNVTFELCTFNKAELHSQGGITIGINANAPDTYDANVLIKNCMAKNVRNRPSGGPHYDGHLIVIGHGNVTIDGFIGFDCPLDNLIAGYSESNGSNNEVNILNSVLVPTDGIAAINSRRRDNVTADRLVFTETNNLITNDPSVLSARFQGSFTGDQSTWSFDDFRGA